VNNAGAVRVGRRENSDEAELQARIDVTAPSLLTRATPPVLRNSSDAMMVNVSSDIVLVGAPFYETYATVTAGVAYFGEAPRPELKREGIHVLTVSSPLGRTPMMRSNRVGPEPGFTREPASAVADVIAEGIETGAFEVVPSGQAPAQMIALNRENPAAVDERLLGLKPALEEAVKDYSAL
jgi:short-subunit dehydrogenase